MKHPSRQKRSLSLFSMRRRRIRTNQTNSRLLFHGSAVRTVMNTPKCVSRNHSHPIPLQRTFLQRTCATLVGPRNLCRHLL